MAIAPRFRRKLGYKRQVKIASAIYQSAYLIFSLHQGSLSGDDPSGGSGNPSPSLSTRYGDTWRVHREEFDAAEALCFQAQVYHGGLPPRTFAYAREEGPLFAWPQWRGEKPFCPCAFQASALCFRHGRPEGAFSDSRRDRFRRYVVYSYPPGESDSPPRLGVHTFDPLPPYECFDSCVYAKDLHAQLRESVLYLQRTHGGQRGTSTSDQQAPVLLEYPYVTR